VLVMPSTWLETFGMTAVEAMLRGIPVVASDIGGLPEAMLGVPHLLPPRATDTWVSVVSRLLTDPTHYREISAMARRAAIRFAAAARIEAVSDYLSEAVSGNGGPARGAEPDDNAVRRRVEDLSPAQRRLLSTMLARQARE
jgi:glycosyltransferase involved in cell wall biosynthesis